MSYFASLTLKEALRLAERPEGVTRRELAEALGLPRRSAAKLAELVEAMPGAEVELEDTWRAHPTKRIRLPGGDHA